MTALNATPGTDEFTSEVYARMGITTEEQLTAQVQTIDELVERGERYVHAAHSDSDAPEVEADFQYFMDLAWVGLLYTKGELA